MAVACTKYARSITKDDPSTSETEWAFEFSPETFSDTSPEYAIRVCEAVKQAWGPTESNPIVFNLPATVEMATPNVYADQVGVRSSHFPYMALADSEIFRRSSTFAGTSQSALRSVSLCIPTTIGE